MHTFSLRLAQSKADCRVKGPGQDAFLPVTTGLFSRYPEVATSDDGRLVASVDGESLEREDLEVRGGTLVDGKKGKAIQLSGETNTLA